MKVMEVVFEVLKGEICLPVLQFAEDIIVYGLDSYVAIFSFSKSLVPFFSAGLAHFI